MISAGDGAYTLPSSPGELASITGPQALQAVQFVTVAGRRLAVLDAADWAALIEWIETLEDFEVAQSALAELKAAGGDRQAAGWIEWETAKQTLD